MVERVVRNYYTFFDETIQSSTFIVVIIALLICAVWIIAPAANKQIELNAAPQENIIMIDGVEYRVQFIKKVQN